MAVTPGIVEGIPIWTRSGAADFYAIFDHNNPRKPLISIHYDSRTVINRNYILEPNYLHPQIGIWEDPNTQANQIRNKLESFLLHLYGAGIFISSQSMYHDLDSDIKAAGLSSMYDSVNVLDFMVLTGAKNQFYKLPDGTVKDLTTLGPDDDNIREFLTDVPDVSWDLMKDIIRHIGLKGLVPYLYASRGIDFDSFVELIHFFYTNPVARAVYFATELDPFLKSKRVPMFTDSQLLQLGV